MQVNSNISVSLLGFIILTFSFYVQFFKIFTFLLYKYTFSTLSKKNLSKKSSDIKGPFGSSFQVLFV